MLFVSILVLLEVPLRPKEKYRRGGQEQTVSILVLLEVPLRLIEMLQDTIKYKLVSILVLLEVPLRPNTERLRAIAELEFQSLFCWKFLLGQYLLSVFQH